VLEDEGASQWRLRARLSADTVPSAEGGPEGVLQEHNKSVRACVGWDGAAAGRGVGRAERQRLPRRLRHRPRT
jgi:hypothetical protein